MLIAHLKKHIYGSDPEGSIWKNQRIASSTKKKHFQIPIIAKESTLYSISETLIMFKTQPTEKHQKHQKSKNTSLQNKLFTGGTQRD